MSDPTWLENFVVFVFITGFAIALPMIVLSIATMDDSNDSEN